MRRVLPSVVTLLGVLFLVGGGIGLLVSLAHIVGDKSHSHLGSDLVALLWAVSALLLGWAVLSSRFLFYAVGTLVNLGETISTWVMGRPGEAIYGTIVTSILLAYAWRWLREAPEEVAQQVAENPR